ncbi:MAG: peroxiredoxin family protein [Chitinophagaceae bacterium]
MRLTILLSFFMAPFLSFSQEDDAPFLKNPTIPNFSILKEDSTSWYSSRELKKGNSVIIMLFSPECGHCKEQTEILIKNMDKLKNTEIVMSTFQSISKMKEFCNQYKLERFPNIHMGRDVNYFLGTYYRIKYSPFVVIYDKDRNLTRVYEGGAKIEKIMEALH